MEQQGLHKEQAAEQGHSSCSSCPSADFRQTPTSFTGTSLLRAASYSVDTVRQIFRQQHARSEIAAQTHTSCTGTSLPDAASYSLRVMRSFLVVQEADRGERQASVTTATIAGGQTYNVQAPKSSRTATALHHAVLHL